MAAKAPVDLSPEERREIAAWIEANREALPAPVRSFLELHERYLAAGEGDPQRRALEAALRELRRALHLTPSSEKRRSSGRPLDGLPKEVAAKSEREKLEAQISRGDRLSEWHRELKKQHDRQLKQLRKRLAKMPADKPSSEDLPLDEHEPTEEERAADRAADIRFTDHLQEGGGKDPAMTPVREALMPGGSALLHEEQVYLPAEIPEDLAGAQVVETWTEPRVRYDFSVAVTRLELEVEKKIVVDHDGERIVLSPPTSEYGPARYAVTWSALATLAELAGQMALPFNRLAKMLSTPEKTFTAAALSRMLHYVAQRFVGVYLALGEQLADSDYLGGDDTSARVLEVSSYFEKLRALECT
ncbi:MAG: transposase, partial [Deltaproteobacteria bacterium]|nr:transposase [Deltaproteobacteria bacterium]